MFIIVGLLVYALLLGGPVARLLARARWASRFPQTALRCWQACAVSLFAAVASLLLLLGHDAWEHSVAWLFDADMWKVHAAYGGHWLVEGINQTAPWVLSLGVFALVVPTLWHLVRLRRERRRHRLTADAVSAPGRIGDGDVRVLPHSAPAVFCVPGGRNGSRIVVTTAAVEMLSERELAAALEHERAHLKYRHHRAFLTADVLLWAFRWSRFARMYARQVRRLAEMAADDEAARKYGRRHVASALLEMCQVGPTVLTPGLPALTGTDPAERVRRLIKAAPSRAKAWGFALGVAVSAVVPVLPLLLALTPAFLLAGTAHGC
ncbi:M56 family metallopeptidase [Streptomyces poonensis]|uniref:Peptidase M48 domain-containing protein n=1 Tax=Streptomyces poonensis TaxID=68255 RepID=A0A918PGK6_9ACTN|nr:M56 family metallopeptidase [Streptomyces poonensis]GGZ07919.1 hypothetical protein GCM10010365_28830 [Streptomyces poonensis]GLJ88490.1 hypothetical protein GCM10017589_10900 [Streptomyces poonensis]